MLECVCVWLSNSATPWTVVHQAPLSKGFSRQEYCSGLPFPSPRDLPDLGIKPTFPALQADSLLSEPLGKSPWFSDILKIQLLLGRKFQHADHPARRLFASPRSSAHPPALHPPQKELHAGSLLLGGRVSGTHLNTLNLGKANSELLKEVKSSGTCQLCPTLRLHGQYSPWNSPGRNTGMGSFSLLQGIFPSQELNQGFLHCRLILYQLSYSSTKQVPSLTTDLKKKKK